MDEEQSGGGAGHRICHRHPTGQYRTLTGTPCSFSPQENTDLRNTTALKLNLYPQMFSLTANAL